MMDDVFPVRSECWVGPAGECYLCEFRQHLERAKQISMQIYGTEKGEEFLEGKGWIKVYLDGRTTNCNDYHCTQKQLDTLFWLTDALTDSWDWKKNLEAEIRKYVVD
jgi:hypothetical protein